MIESLLLVGSVLTQGLTVGAARASDGLRRRAWVVTAFASMAVSVVFMAQAIARGLSLAVGYGIWSGAGIALATATGVVVFGDRLARVHAVGLALVFAGVVVVYGGG